MGSHDQVDIIEDTLRRHGELLGILLIDRSRSRANKTHNILWATDSYAGHKPKDEILEADITGPNKKIIQPRISKTKGEQKARTKEKAEVFTPRLIVDQMNKQIDSISLNWPATDANWQDYVMELRLEITCGEAPYIVGRYNAVSGKKILNLDDRVGFLDRKMRVVSEFCNEKYVWLEWAKKAFMASYGYEWQGDNLLLARENLLYSFIDYWNNKFPNDKINLERTVAPEKMNYLEEIAGIISWNIFQMDGVKCVVPMSCKNEKVVVKPGLPIFGIPAEYATVECAACRKNSITGHNGVYAKIMDWGKNKPIRFIDLFS